jgi:heptosyltransferase-2
VDNTNAVPRSLIVAPQWIGDAVMTEPLLRILHARGEHLTVGALPWVAPVYRAMPQVAEVIEFPFAHGGLQWAARRKLAAQVQGRFDVAYVLPNSLKSALLPWLAKIPKRVGYLGESRVGLLTHRLKNPGKDNRPPMVAFYGALSGQADLGAQHPQLQLAPEVVSNTLNALGLVQGDYTVLAPGAEFGPAKRWPVSHYAQLAALLGRPVVLLGSGKEFDVCQDIASAAGVQAHCVNLAGKTSLAQAMAVIAGSRNVVSNDSGLMHVAAALGCAQVAIFGSSSPLHTPPLNPAAHVLWLKTDASYRPALDCAPCFERDCRLPAGAQHLRCLNDIGPQEVLNLQR